jgi:hypothetical protein
MADHALLKASGASRWLKCPPSARLEENLPESQSAYADEGKQAHKLAENELRKYLALPEIALDFEPAPEMKDAIQLYVDTCIEKINEARARCKDTKIMLEQRLYFSEWVPEGFGTGDLVIIADGLIEVIDLKYGKGVPVSAENNPQMRLYALGAVNHYGHLYDVDAISATIIQPRLDSISTETLRIGTLLEWGDQIRAIAAQAFKGEGEFAAGDQCRFCRAKVKCRARAEANLEMARHEFRDPALLSDAELAKILAKADQLAAWASDVHGYALAEAEKGKVWPGWKLVEGRRVRKYADADKVAETLIGAGYPDAILFERSLLGITAMEKAVGKKKFSELLADLIITPPGKPALVPESDKRAPLKASAADDFAE